MDTLKKLSTFILLAVTTSTMLPAQNATESIVVGTVAGEDVTYEELMSNYSINSSVNSSDKTTFRELKEFLPIYLDYKAKILAGKEFSYHTDSALVAEYTTYTKQAAYSYWLENDIKPSAFEEFKKRSEIELKTFHILIAVDQHAPEDQVNEAITALQSAKTELEEGGDPQKVDEKYSTVRNGRSMGGDIPWITAGRTIKEFEDQAYKLEVGEVSEPFRTQFGYHAVLLQDKRTRIPSRLVRHIFVRETNDSTSFQKISDAYRELEDGTSWQGVVSTYSEDRSTIQNGGLLGWINYQAANNSFVDAAMSADAEAAYTEPTRTDFGYHIFKVDSVEHYVSEADRDEALREQLEQTPYYESNNEFVLEYLSSKFDQPVSDENIVALTGETFPEFKKQAQSFMHGLIVFKLNEEQVWSAATADTSRLRTIYTNNPDRYSYPKRPFYYLITAGNDSTLDKAIQFVHNDGRLDSLTSAINGVRVSVDSTTTTLSEPFTILEEMEAQSFSNKFDYHNNRGVFWLEKKLEPRKMTFDEAFNLVLNDYQPQREQEWTEKLREKFNVLPDYDKLREAHQKDS